MTEVCQEKNRTSPHVQMHHRGRCGRTPGRRHPFGDKPLSRFTGGIHVCGGDFFAMARSQWNPETLGEEPSDGETIRGIFRRENERMRRCEAL